MSSRAKRQGIEIREAAKDIEWVGRNWERYVQKLADFEARGWPERTSNETGIVGKGGTPAGLKEFEDRIRADRVKHLNELADIFRTARRIRLHAQSIAYAIEPAAQYIKPQQCANPACDDDLDFPEGDIALHNTDRCPPCDRYLKTEGHDAPAKVVRNRQRMRDSRAS